MSAGAGSAEAGSALDRLLADTWPPAETLRLGPALLRRSPGGGQRVQAASLQPGAEADPALIAEAATRMRGWGQVPMWRLDPEAGGLDAALAGAGYARRDPTCLMTGPLDPLLAVPTPRLSTFALWPPLAIMAEIWAAGGIGADRLAVMARARGPMTALMARDGDRPVATAFVALSGRTAVVHALEVLPRARRRGVARRLMGRAGQWAREQGADGLAALVTEANTPARGLYASLGMAVTGRYHYRRLEDPT